MTQNNGFSQFFIGDFNNTLTDISAYVKSAKVPLNFAVIDLTTFVPGAVTAPTTQQKHGQIQSDFSITIYDDLAIYPILEQIAGLRGGVTFKAFTGRNSVPVGGDFVYQASLTLFSVTSDWTTKKDATSVLNLKPTDGGLIVPSITRF
jgi:hypothetical protein